MTREDDLFIFRLFIQKGKSGEIIPLNPLIISYSAETEEFIYLDDLQNWNTLTKETGIQKEIYCFFSLLEHLSPELKVNSRCSIAVKYIKTETNQIRLTYLLRISKELAQLELLFKKPKYFKVVQKNSEEVYIGSREMAEKLGDSTYIKLDSPYPFGEIELEIIKTTLQNCIQKDLINNVGKIMVSIKYQDSND